MLESYRSRQKLVSAKRGKREKMGNVQEMGNVGKNERVSKCWGNCKSTGRSFLGPRTTIESAVERRCNKVPRKREASLSGLN